MYYNTVEAAAILSALNKLDYEHPVVTARLRMCTIIVSISPEGSNMVTTSFHERGVKNVSSSKAE